MLLFLSFLIYATFVEYSPSEVEDITVIGDEMVLDKDTITILSWNVGYCGLGSDMDFFMDGGQSSRTSRGRTEQNLKAVVSLIEKYAS